MWGMKLWKILFEAIGCFKLQWLISYLRAPLGSNSRSESFQDEVVEKVSRQLKSWKGILLSLGGIVTLIQACLSSIPLYYLSLFRTNWSS